MKYKFDTYKIFVYDIIITNDQTKSNSYSYSPKLLTKLMAYYQRNRNKQVCLRLIDLCHCLLCDTYWFCITIPMKFCHNAMHFQVKERKIIEIGPHTRKFDFCGPESHLGKVQNRIWNPLEISKSKRKKILKSVQKQRNYAYIKNAKKHFYISAFCSLTGRPTEKIFTE